jgi:hypothetical protein
VRRLTLGWRKRTIAIAGRLIKIVALARGRSANYGIPRGQLLPAANKV